MGTALLTLGLAAAVAIAGTVVVRTIRELIESRLGSVEERFDRRLSEVHEGFDRRLEGSTAGFSQPADGGPDGDPDRRPAEQARRNRGADAPEGRRPRSPRAGPSPAQGAGRRRRDAARQPSARHAPGGRVPPAVHVPVRRTRRRSDPGRQAPARRREVPARQLRAARERGGRRRARVAREGVRPRCEGAHRRDRREVHPPAEGTFDFAFMYLPSEAVYYELVCGKTGNLSAYAHGKRVIAVSQARSTRTS